MTPESEVTHFDRWAATYDQSGVQRYLGQLHGAMLDLIAPQLAPGGPRLILDVGCGTGRLLRAAAARWPEAHLVGVDPAAQMIAHAERANPAGQWHVAPAEALPLGAASVDLVLTCVALHHWTDPVQGLTEIIRVLAPSGWLCLSDIVLPRWAAGVLRSRARTAAGLAQLVSERGLTVVRERRELARVVAVLVAQKPPAGGS